jgi:ribosomal protein S7
MQNKTVYFNLLGSLIKKGQKIKAQSILRNSFINVSDSLNLSISKIFNKIGKKAGNLLELRKIKIRRNVHLVPFPTTINRRRFLLSKQLVSGVKINKKKINTSKKLAEQLISFLIKRGYNYNKKKLLIKQIVTNRSNIHYRW